MKQAKKNSLPETLNVAESEAVPTALVAWQR